MNSRIFLTFGAAVLIPCAVLAQNPPAATPPEAARLQGTEQADAPQRASEDPYADLNKRVQEKLRAIGLYDGPVNGDFGPNTQAALARFQLSWPLPVNGMLDADTLAALGLESSETASAGPSEPPGARQLGGSCDALIGPEKERCVQQGGSVEASANAEASSGASRAAEPKGN